MTEMLTYMYDYTERYIKCMKVIDISSKYMLMKTISGDLHLCITNKNIIMKHPN